MNLDNGKSMPDVASWRQLCSSLSCSGEGATVLPASEYGDMSGSGGKIWLDDLQCNGDEMTLDDCGKHSGGWGAHNCGCVPLNHRLSEAQSVDIDTRDSSTVTGVCFRSSVYGGS